MYRGIRTARYHKNRNNINIPFLLSIIQADVANKMKTAFAVEPVVEFVGGGPEDAFIARKQTSLVNQQFVDAGMWTKARRVFLTANMYGTSVVNWGWETKETKKKIRRIEMDPMTGEAINFFEEEMVTEFNGPQLQDIDRIDFYPEPGPRCLPEMKRVAVVEWTDFDEVRQLMETQTIDGETFYDKAALPDLINSREAGGPGMEYWDRRWTGMPEKDTSLDEIARPVRIIHYHGWVPRELAPDGYQLRLISVANGKALLRNIPHPMGEIPFFAYSPIEDPHYFDSIGKLEIGERMQASGNKFVNQLLDALDLTIDPMWLIDSNAGIKKQRLLSRSGGVVEVDGPVTDQTIRPMSPSLQGMREVFPNVAMMWNFMQQGTGVYESSVMGGPGTTKRETAREFMGKQGAASVRLFLESKAAEEQWIQPFANRARYMNRLWLPLPQQVDMIGKDAVINPITGQPESQKESISLDELEMDYDARARGATQLMSRDQKIGELFQLTQALGGVPPAMIAVNWVNYLRDVFHTFEKKNVDELLVQQGSPEQGTNAMAMGLLQQGGGEGGSPAGLPQPNPMAGMMGQVA